MKQCQDLRPHPEGCGRIFRDLADPFWMRVKGVLFVILGFGAAGLVLYESPSWRVAALMSIAVWAFCRAYYFAFYVIEKYIDPTFRFSGLGAAAVYLLRGRARREGLAGRSQGCSSPEPKGVSCGAEKPDLNLEEGVTN